MSTDINSLVEEGSQSYTWEGSQVYLGWLREYEDNDWLNRTTSTFTAPSNLKPPEKIDPRQYLKTEQQGQISACSGNGSTTVLEYAVWVQTKGQRIQLSRKFAYLMGQRVDGIRGDRGATISGVVKSLMQNGICTEKTCPYFSGRYETSIPQLAFTEAANHKVLQQTDLKGPKGTARRMFNYLAAGAGGVIIGIPWTEELAQMGVHSYKQSRGKTLGGHCVAVIGYLYEDGELYFIIANSHGPQWGENGFGLFHASMFDNYGRDGYSEIRGVSDLDNYGRLESDASDRTDWNWQGSNPWLGQLAS